MMVLEASGGDVDGGGYDSLGSGPNYGVVLVVGGLYGADNTGGQVGLSGGGWGRLVGEVLMEMCSLRGRRRTSTSSHWR